MDNETFYDSLEESFSSASSTSVVIVIKPNFSSYINHIPQEMDEDVRINLEEIVNSVEESSTASSSSEVLLYNHSENVVETEHDSQIKSISQYEICYENPNDKINRLKAKWGIVNEPDISSITKWDNVNDISSIVPLYGGDINRSEIELSMKSSSTPALNRKKLKINNKPSNVLTNINKNCNKFKQRSKLTKSNYHNSDSCLSIDSLPKSNSTKSYLKIFHSRTACPKMIDDTTRPFLEDSTRRFIEEESADEFADAEAGYGSDSTSFYLQYVENSGSKSHSKAEDLHASPGSIGSSVTPAHIVSVSELFLNDNVKASQKKTQIPKRPIYTPVPYLGGLGPDRNSFQEKLERRKKQISYGQKASNRNRIKMVESKVLKNLNKEMIKSNCLNNEMQKL